MKKVYYLIFLLPIFIWGQTTSVEFPKIMPPSPNASSFAQYGNLPVNNYTGIPNISIPLYNIKSGEIELPISMSYHASGIKVAQEASSIGLGWVLNAGGVISRSVHGVDDLEPIWGYVINDNIPSLETEEIIAEDFSDNYTTYKEINSGLLDGKPDVLYYNFMGKSGKMIFEKKQANSNKIKGIPLQQNNFTFVYDLDTEEWEVTDGNGWKYYFNVKEISRDFSRTSLVNTSAPYLLDDLDRSHQYNRLGPDDYTEYISSWFINKIVTPKGDTLLFEYDGQEGYKSMSQLRFYEQESFYGNPLYGSSNNVNSWHGDFKERKYFVNASMTSSDNLNLKKISFKNGFINFNTSTREDIRPAEEIIMDSFYPAPRKMDFFEVFNLDGKSIKKVEFNYSYFNENITVDNKENYWRLKLDSVQESFYNDNLAIYKSIPAYRFTYNSTDLPDKTSASVDHWGYYNGVDNDHIKYYEDYTNSLFGQYPITIDDENSTTYSETHQTYLPYQLEYGLTVNNTTFPFLNGAYRESDTIKMQAAILTRIDYPTGGATRFSYEANKYTPNEDVDVYRYKNQQYSVFHEGEDPEDETQSFYLNLPTLVKIDCNIHNYGSSSALTNIEALIEDSSGTPILSFKPSVNSYTRNVSLILQPGTYYLRANTNAELFSMSISLRINYMKRFNTLEAIGGGLRIAKQESLNDDGNIALTQVYNYTLGDAYTSGVAMSDIQHFYKDGGDTEYLNSDHIPQAFNHVIVRSSENNAPMSSSAQGNYVGYSEVSVSDIDQLGNPLGKSIYYYVNNPDEEGNYHIPGMPIFSHMNNGNLLKIESYNANNDLLKIVENTYVKNEPSSFFTQGLFTSNILKDRPYPYASFGYGFLASFYHIYSEWWHPETTIETIYDVNGNNAISKTITYDFENSEHKNLTKTTTTNSKGETIITTNKYPQDLTSGIDETSSVIIANMITDNVINPVLKTETSVNGTIVQGKITNYTTKSNFYVPLNIKSLQRGTTSTYDEIIDFVEYYDNGNFLEVKRTDGNSIVYLWGYNNEYPIAKIENATISEVESAIGQSIDEIDENDILIIDNLRSSLTDALITTYTYNPLIGITSITDPRGYTTTYEYDDFNRLKLVKDAEGNILSKNEYHYQNQQ